MAEEKTKSREALAEPDIGDGDNIGETMGTEGAKVEKALEAEEEAKLKIVFKPRQIVKSLLNCVTLIYGVPKIGKSTLASQFPGPLFLATEEGLNWIDVPKISIVDWDKTEMHMLPNGGIEGSFCDVCMWLRDERPTVIPGTDMPLQTLVIDNVDLAHMFCVNTVCANNNIASPADMAWGKGWKLVNDEWISVLANLPKLGYGLVFTSHEKESLRKSQATEISVIGPSLPGFGAKPLLAMVDVILYCYMDEYAEKNEEGNLTGKIIEERRIQCAPRNNLVAGDRTRLLPPSLPLSYEALMEYFPDTPVAKESEPEAKIEKKKKK